MFKVSKPSSEQPWDAAARFAHQWGVAVQQDPGRYAEAASQFVGVPPIYMDQLFQGLDDAAKNQRDFPWPAVFDLVAHAISNVGGSIGKTDSDFADASNWMQACHSACELLKSGLRRGAESIALEHAVAVKTLIFSLLERAPHDPEVEEFEERFARDGFLAAAATLRGSAVELCVLCLFWLSKNSLSSIATAPRTGIQALPEIAGAFERQIEDRSLSGRIPRAVMGRYLGWIFYFGPGWTRDHLKQIFPETDDTLRHAAWQAYMLHGGHPVKELYTELTACYVDELLRLTSHSDSHSDVDFRRKQFGGHLLVLYLNDTLQRDDGPFAQFIRSAPSKLRQHIMWCVGRYLVLPPDHFPQKDRGRALAYWDARLAEAMAASNPDAYREELGTIGHWVNNPQLETSWLLEELLTMLGGGFTPSLGFNIVAWLSNVCTQDAERSVRILAAMIENSGCKPDTYMAQDVAIRKILTEAANSESAAIISLVNQTISILSTRGETRYLDLERHR